MIALLRALWRASSGELIISFPIALSQDQRGAGSVSLCQGARHVSQEDNINIITA